MKIVNIILSVLILLLAAASAVFSYFLFEKRGQFVTGWAKMAETVNKSAAALDKNSGTAIAGKLSVQALSHEKYADLDKLLPELPKLSAQIITERDALANALARVGHSVGARVDGTKMCNLNTYATGKDSVISAVADTVNRRDRTYRNMNEIFRSELEIGVDRGKLLTGDSGAFRSFRDELRRRNARQRSYESLLRENASRFGAGSMSFDERNYQKSLKKLRDAANKFMSEHNRISRELSRAKAENVSKANTIRNRDKEIRNLKDVLVRKNTEIRAFKGLTGIPAVAESPSSWDEGSPEARAQIRGKVTAVNNDYGYIVMDIGKFTVVRQRIAGKNKEINPKIEAGLDMYIKRGSKLLAKVKISEVGENVSVANIPVDADEIEPGDTVIYAIPEKAEKKAPGKKTSVSKGRK